VLQEMPSSPPSTDSVKSSRNPLKRDLTQHEVDHREIETPRKVVVLSDGPVTKPDTQSLTEPPLITWLSRDSDISLPPLPVVADSALLFRFWENVDPTAPPARNHRRDPDLPKPRDWRHLERLGDTYITMISQQELSRIFGRRNTNLIGLISDHANSNNLFAQVARYYKLEKRVRVAPLSTKRWADIFEAWIGCHIVESQLYNQDDPMCQLRHFLYQLWSTRYRQLMVYAYNPSAHCHISPDEIESTSHVKIYWPHDSLLLTTLASLRRDSQQRDVGYLINYNLKKGKPRQDFVLCEVEAEELISRRICAQRKSTHAVLT
jgi:hypothetical protein